MGMQIGIRLILYIDQAIIRPETVSTNGSLITTSDTKGIQGIENTVTY